MLNLNLPRNYLSHSQCDLWTKSKPDYRKRYYEGRSMYITPELEFGKLVGGQYEALHSDPQAPLIHEVIRRVPRGTIPEYELKCELRGVPVLGFIDSFDEDDMGIDELKTGKTPWTQARTDKHHQLKMYCAAVRKLLGTYNPYVNLHWLVTESYDEYDDIDGIRVPRKAIRLTGEYVPFRTTVQLSDIIEYEKHIEQVAREISEDYTIWQKLHPTPVFEGTDAEGCVEIDGVRLKVS